MVDFLSQFEKITRNSFQFSESTEEVGTLHPFDERNVHVEIADVCRQLFDNAHYSQATFEAYKLLDKKIQMHSGLAEAGMKLMMQAFNEKHPLVKLTPLANTSEVDEQNGYKFLFSGGVMAIRNPRGHEVRVDESPSECLDHLGLASLLLRRIEKSGYV